MRLLFAVECVVIAVIGFATSAADFNTAPPKFTARVVMTESPEATEAFAPRFEQVQTMLERGLTNLLSTSNASAAWLSLVSTQDVVGLKVYSLPGPNSGTRPAVVEAVARGLITAGIPPKQIVIWDRYDAELRAAGFFELGARLGVRVESSAHAGFCETNYYDRELIGNLIYGDLEFGRTDKTAGRRSYVSKLVNSDITKIISIAPLLNHPEVGVSGHIYGLAIGSVDNSVRFESSGGRLAEHLPDIYALPGLYDHVVLGITDALVCQYEGGQRGLLHYSTILNQLWLSRDLVALDVLSAREIEKQRRGGTRSSFQRLNLDLYRNVNLMERGESDVTKIKVDLVK